MFAAIEIAGFVVAFASAIWLARRDRRGLLQIAIAGSVAVLIAVLLIGLLGAPLFLHRFERVTLKADVVALFVQAHHNAGHWFITALVVFWPFVFVASVARPATALRKFGLGALALLQLVLFLLVSFTGYALPKGMPRELPLQEMTHALRFVILHVVFGPLLVIVVTAVLLWRHVRARRHFAATTNGPTAST